MDYDENWSSALNSSCVKEFADIALQRSCVWITARALADMFRYIAARSGEGSAAQNYSYLPASPEAKRPRSPQAKAAEKGTPGPITLAPKEDVTV